MSKLFGTRALARELGVTPPAVTKAVKDGRIAPAKIDGKRALFDLDEVRVKWQPNALQSGTEDIGDSNNDDNVRYRKARADKEESLAAQEKLALGEMRKELLPASEVVAVWTQLLRAFSQTLSGMPPKLLSRYPGLTGEGRDFLTEMLRQAVDDLSAWEPK